MVLQPRIASLSSNAQQSVDIFKESPTDPPSLEYKVSLSDFVNSNLDAKELFMFSGILKQLSRLGLFKKKVKFLDSWCGLWWKMLEDEPEPIRDDSISRLCKKLQVEEWMIRAYLRPDFFTKYEQAKNKYQRSL
jgi:hypothetical protein